MSFLTNIETTWFVISLFLLFICTGLVAVWDYRCKQVNELREENEALRKIIKRNHDRRKIN